MFARFAIKEPGARRKKREGGKRRGVLEHVARDAGYPRPGADAGLGGRLLQARLDGVDGRVGEGAHRAGDEADEHVLVRGQVGSGGLQTVQEFLEFLVGCEVRACARRMVC